MVPGELDYTYTKKLTLYTLNTTDSGPDYLSLSTLGPYDYKMTRSFLNVTWNQTKSTLDYREKYYYTQITKISGDPETDKERQSAINNCSDSCQREQGYGNATASTNIT